MRVTLPALLWLLAMACCFAQQQEQKLMDRIEAQNPTKHPYANSMSTKTFKGGGDLSLNASRDGSTTFSGAKDFNSGTYETRSFLGIKNPWFGNKVYVSKPADLTSKSGLTDGNKKFSTDTAATKEFEQAGKKAPDQNDDVKTKPYVVKGAAQGGVDQLKKNLTIDDVREILNKNH